MASDASCKLLAPPVNFRQPPAGECIIVKGGGYKPLNYKHINRGLTYDLLIVIYHLLKIEAFIFYQNIAHIHFRRGLPKKFFFMLLN